MFTFSRVFSPGFLIINPSGGIRETLRAVTIKFNFATLELSPHIDFIHGNIFLKIKQHQNLPIEGHRVSPEQGNSHDPFKV